MTLSTLVRALALAVASVGLSLVALALLAPISPQAWMPPAPYFASGACDAAPTISLEILADGLPGVPDGLAISPDGRLLAALSSGDVVSVDRKSGEWRSIARTNVRLSGIAVSTAGDVFAVSEEAGPLFGIQRSRLVPVLSEVDGIPLHWTNDVTATDAGDVFLTSTAANRQLSESYLEVLEHRGTGRLYRFEPTTGRATIVRDGLLMANGVAFDRALDALLVAETSAYRLSRLKRDGTVIDVLDGLPGFVGNIRASDRRDIFWLTVLSPRNPTIDAVAGAPALRRLMAWLPKSMRSNPTQMACVVEVHASTEGMTAKLYRAVAAFPFASFSTAIEREGELYLSPASIVSGAGGQIYRAHLAVAGAIARD